MNRAPSLDINSNDLIQELILSSPNMTICLTCDSWVKRENFANHYHKEKTSLSATLCSEKQGSKGAGGAVVGSMYCQNTSLLIEFYLCYAAGVFHSRINKRSTFRIKRVIIVQIYPDNSQLDCFCFIFQCALRVRYANTKLLPF